MTGKDIPAGLQRTDALVDIDKAPITSRIDRAQFCELLLSRRKLIRRDDPFCGLVGLVDAQSGKWFVLQEQALHSVRD